MDCITDFRPHALGSEVRGTLSFWVDNLRNLKGIRLVKQRNWLGFY